MNNKNLYQWKEIGSVGYIIFPILLVLASIFYVERTICIDHAFYVEQLIEHRNFTIQHGRFISILTQFPTLITILLNGSLKSVLFIYSITFILLYFIYYIIIDKWIDNKRFTLFPIIMLLLIGSHCFYAITSEYQQGIMLTSVFFAAWEKKQNLETGAENKGETILLYVLSAIVLIFAHPLMWVMMLYGLGFMYLDNKNKRDLFFISLTILIALVGFIKYKFYFEAYDANASKVTLENFFNNWRNIAHLDSTKQLLIQFKGDFILFPISIIAIIAYYISRKELLKPLLVLSAVAFMLVLNLAGYPQGVDKFYLDIQYLTFSFLLSLPLALDVLPAIVNRKMGLIIVYLILAFRIGFIITEGRFYTKRLTYMSELLTNAEKTTQTSKSDRYVLTDADVDKNILFQPWSLAYESLLYSELKGYKVKQIVSFPDTTELKRALENKDQIVFRWGAAHVDALNPYCSIDTHYRYYLYPIKNTPPTDFNK